MEKYNHLEGRVLDSLSCSVAGMLASCATLLFVVHATRRPPSYPLHRHRRPLPPHRHRRPLPPFAPLHRSKWSELKSCSSPIINNRSYATKKRESTKKQESGGEGFKASSKKRESTKKRDSTKKQESGGEGFKGSSKKRESGAEGCKG
ncbi:hypothetical protein TB2_021219 [Malus domestica]